MGSDAAIADGRRRVYRDAEKRGDTVPTVNRAIEERLATGVLAIGRPVATAPKVDIRLGAGPIAVLPIPSRSPIEWIRMEGREKMRPCIRRQD